MILAALGPIHGNAKLLIRVLDAIEEEGIQTVLCTGDCADGPQPNEVIAALRQARVHIVQGESDRQLARFVRKRKRLERELGADRLQQLESINRACNSANIEWLAGLPHHRTLTIDGEPIVLFSGTISSAGARLTENDPDQNFRRQREIVPAQVYICGGDDHPFARFVDDALFANPGALSPAGSNAARYLVVSTESDRPTAEWRSLPVDSGA